LCFLVVVVTGGIDVDLVVVAALIVVVSGVAVRWNPVRNSNMALLERGAGAKPKQLASFTGSV